LEAVMDTIFRHEGYNVPARRRPAPWRTLAPGRLLDLLLGWQERAQQRHALASLEDALLKDIGLSRADAMHEARKPFWRA